MSRYRTIKPEFWTSAQVVECSTNARLMFVGLWNFCDDFGRHVFSPKQIKAEIFPADDFSSENIRGMLDELSSNGLIVVYSAENKDILQVTGWHHQKIDKPQKARFPGPFDESSTIIRGTIDERTKEERSKEEKKIRECSGREGKGREYEGREGKGRASGAETTTTNRKIKNQISEKEEPSEQQLMDAEKQGLSGTERIAEWTKFRNYNLAKGSELADWDAAWRMWLEKVKPHGKPNGHDAKPQVFVEKGTPQWNAWVESYLKSCGRPPPKTTKPGTMLSGWYFKTEWPPEMRPKS